MNYIKKISQFNTTTGLTEDAYITVIQGNPVVENYIISKQNFANSIVTSLPGVTKDYVDTLVSGETANRIDGDTNLYNLITGLTEDLNGKSDTGHTHSQYLTGYTETNPGVYTSGQTDQLLLGKANQSTELTYDPSTNADAIADVHLAAYANYADSANSTNYATYDSLGNLIDTHYATQSELQAVEDGASKTGHTHTEYSKEPLSITYADLYNLTQTSGLSVGQRYIINDYQTVHTIPTTIDTNTGQIEPLLVEALTTSKLKNECYSTLFPQDIIYYDIENNEAMVNGCNSTNGGRGYIYRRIDTLKNNDIGFDYRQVKFRRWQLNVTVEHIDGNGSYSRGSVIKKTGTNEIYIKLTDLQGFFSDTEKWKRYEFDNLQYVSYLQDGMSFAGCAIPSNASYFDYYMFSTTPTVSGVQSNFENIYNNKFKGNNSDIITNSNSVLFGDNFYNNTIGDSFNYNTIGTGFNSNTIGDSFNYNTIGTGFNSNTIGNYFSYNTIGNYFYSNTIVNSFYSNTIGNDFNSNTIGYNFISNTIGDYFSSNSIRDFFISNTIGNYFSYNTIGNGFYSNTIGNDFTSNTIGNDFDHNTIGDSFRKNNIESSVNSINFVSPLSVYVYLDYPKYIFKTSTETTKLRYYDGNNTLQITNANA